MMVFLDFERVLKSVSHDDISFKMANISMNSGLIRVIKSYLSDFFFSVRVEQVHFTHLLAETGVS